MVEAHGLLSLEGWEEGEGQRWALALFRAIALIESIAIMEAR